MGIERNCPIDTWNTVHLSNDIEVFKRSDIERLLKALTEECRQWQNSDGKIWFDSPERYLREQLNMHDVNDMEGEQHG